MHSSAKRHSVLSSRRSLHSRSLFFFPFLVPSTRDVTRSPALVARVINRWFHQLKSNHDSYFTPLLFLPPLSGKLTSDPPPSPLWWEIRSGWFAKKARCVNQHVPSTLSSTLHIAAVINSFAVFQSCNVVCPQQCNLLDDDFSSPLIYCTPPLEREEY